MVVISLVVCLIIGLTSFRLQQNNLDFLGDVDSLDASNPFEPVLEVAIKTQAQMEGIATENEDSFRTLMENGKYSFNPIHTVFTASLTQPKSRTYPSPPLATANKSDGHTVVVSMQTFTKTRKRNKVTRIEVYAHGGHSWHVPASSVPNNIKTAIIICEVLGVTH